MNDIRAMKMNRINEAGKRLRQCIELKRDNTEFNVAINGLIIALGGTLPKAGVSAQVANLYLIALACEHLPSKELN